MKIRIAYLIDEITSPSAGTEKQLVHLIEGLDTSRFEPLLCVLRSTPWSEGYGGCPVHCVGVDSFRRLSSWRAIHRFADFLRQQKIHCIQTHFRDSAIVGIVAAKMAGGVQVIQTRKNLGYWMRPLDHVVTRLLNPSVDVFVSNSAATRHLMVEKEGVSPNRVRMIHNGLDFSAFPKRDNGTRKRMRRALGLGNSGIGVVVVANLRTVKRIDVFLKAVAEIVADSHNARFFVVGQGDCRDSLFDLASTLGIVGKVRFLGRRNDIPDILSAMDIGVLTSDSESFSNAILEYLAAGLSVVCTDVGGCREALGNNGFGSLVQPGDVAGVAMGIRRYCQDAGRRQANRASAPQAVQSRFSMARYIGGYEKLYVDIVYTGGAS